MQKTFYRTHSTIAEVVPDDGVEQPHAVVASDHLEPELCQHPGPHSPCLIAAAALCVSE